MNKVTKKLTTCIAILLCVILGATNVFAAEESSSKAITCNYTITGNPSNYVCNMTPLQMHGRLAVKGTNIVDANGKAIQLRGVSLHGIQHTNGSTTAFKDYVNKKAFQQLRDEWGVNLIRIPVYTAENGYCQGGAAGMDTTIQNAVSYATSLGMYIIIDWHILSDGNPQTYQNQSIAFFKKYAQKYASNKNIIFEICNEPNGGVDWTTVKKYAIPVIKTIRTYKPNALVIVGTPQWSQLPSYGSYSAADNPIKDSEIGGSSSGLAKNVLYSIHFYAATHYSDIQNNVTYAHNKGLPIFCSEFGITDASGNGRIDAANASSWMKLLKKYGISFACWNLSNNREASAMLKTSCTKLYNWNNNDLTDSGAWFINTVRPMYNQELEELLPTVYNGIDYKDVYDFDFYCNKYSDIKNAFGNNKRGAIEHFVKYGMAEGRQGCASFNVTSYAYKYYDIRKVYKNDLKSYYMHYVNCGKKEGRVATGTTTMQGGPKMYNNVDYSPVFRVGYYANKYSDIRAKYGLDDAKYFDHFLKTGMKYGRQGSAEFNAKNYRKRYPYLDKKYGDDYKSYYTHYIKYGKAHGMNGK